jgi:hypothetical protein
MGEKLMKRCLLAAAICIGCSTSPNVAEPLYGSECVIAIDETEVEGPDFGLTFNHDLGESPGEPTRFTLDLYSYDERIRVGGNEIALNRKYQLVIYDPFGAARIYLRDTLTGDGDEIVYNAYTADTEPEYQGVTVIVEYSDVDMGTWIHILVGSKSKHGVAVLVESIP